MLSVIVPVYNTQDFLSQCLDSIIKQEYSNIEIILVDDGSTDNSGDICDEYAKKDARIVVIHKTHGKPVTARYAGVKKINKPYVTFVDSDDWISKDMYKHLMNLMVQLDLDLITSEIIRWYSETDYEHNHDDYRGGIYDHEPFAHI